ncbi:MAG: DegV family protein [Clostridioides sp.]|jgi:DegV family protein with EDD domain|nr:DegV family protein [Clostridioides sp.]
MSDIKIICDSLSDVPDDMLEKYDIEMVPLTLILGGVEYRDRYDISCDELYRQLRQKDVYAKTSQVTYATFLEVFKKYIDQGREVLYIAGSAAATGTYQSANMAKEDLDGKVVTFDTDSLSFGAGMQVQLAGKLAQEGKSIEEIVPELKKLQEKIYIVFSVDTLDHLQKGGRISSTKAAIGNILNIKPLLEVRDGLVAQLCQVRGKKHVIAKYIEILDENVGMELEGSDVYIGYSDDIKERDQVAEAIREKFNPAEIVFVPLGSCIVAHAGPGVTGVFVHKRY